MRGFEFSASGTARRAGCGAREQLVEFYETEEFLVDTVSNFVGEALHDGRGATIVIATDAHRSAFEAALHASGIDVAAAIARDRYLAVDAAELLTRFMVGQRPDAGRFRDTVGLMVERAATGGRRVRIYSEMVSLLWHAGDVASTIVLGGLWNRLEATHAFALLCAYPMRAFEDEVSAPAFKRICEQHSAVIPSESYSLLESADLQQRAVAQLQQELAALRTSVACLGAERDILDELAHVDALSGLGNRRAFDRHLERERALSKRHGRDSFVLVADLDGFKAYNDAHGHAAGDEMLREFAGVLGAAARSTDILCRIGGDEFGIILINSQEAGVHHFISRVRDAMADVAQSALHVVDVSFGHASLQSSTSARAAFEHGDRAMYASKRSTRGPHGRNGNNSRPSAHHHTACPSRSGLGQTGSRASR